MTSLRICVLLLLGLCCKGSFGQDLYHFDIENENLGVVYDIEEDNAGFIWIGSSTGLWKFDGVEWNRFKISESISSCVLEVDISPQGTVWFLNLEYEFYRIEDGLATKVERNKHLREEKSIGEKIPKFYVDQNNDVIFSSNKRGVLKLTKDELIPQASNLGLNLFINGKYPILCGAVPTKDSVLIHGCSIMKYGENTSSFCSFDSLQTFRLKRLPLSIKTEKALYLTFGRKVFRQSVDTLIQVNELKDYPRSSVELGGTVYVTTSYGLEPLLKADEKNSKGLAFTEFLDISKAMVDSRGICWIGTLSSKFFAIPDQSIKVYQQSDRLSDLVCNETLYYWVRNLRSVYELNRKTGEEKKLFEVNDQITGLFPYQNKLLIGTESDLLVFQNGKVTQVPAFEGINNRTDRRNFSSIQDFFQIEGKIYAPARCGILELTDDDDQIMINERFPMICREMLRSVSFNERLFFLSKYGVESFDTKTKTFELIHGEFHSSIGLSNDHIVFLSKGKSELTLYDTVHSSLKNIDEAYWLQNYNGSAVYMNDTRFISRFEVAQNSFRAIDTLPLPARIGLEDFTGVYSNSNEIVLESKQGLFVINTEVEEQENAPFIYYDVSSDFDYNLNESSDIIETADDLKFSIGYQDFTFNENNKLEYRLSDEKDWMPLVSSELDFEVGNHKNQEISIRLFSEDLNRAIAHKNITVITDGLFISKVILMRVGVLLCCVVFIWLIYKLIRTNQMVSQHSVQIAQKEQIISALKIQPHFINSTLFGAQYLIQQNERKRVLSYLEKVGIYFRHFLQANSEGLISLASELMRIKAYVEIQKVRCNGQIRYSVEFEMDETDLDEYLIPANILQPIIENSIKYSESTGSNELDILVYIQESEDSISIRVDDSGPGIQSLEPRKHPERLHSLELMKQRFQSLSQEFEKDFSIELAARSKCEKSHSLQIIFPKIQILENEN